MMHKMIDLNLNLFFLIDTTVKSIYSNLKLKKKFTINKITHLRSLSLSVYIVLFYILIKLLGQIKLFCKITRDKIKFYLYLIYFSPYSCLN